jgi:hypothetical protein
MPFSNVVVVLQEDVWQRGRLNYRDEESAPIRPADQQQQQDPAWQAKKSLKKKEKHKKKVSSPMQYTYLFDFTVRICCYRTADFKMVASQNRVFE